MNWRECPSHDLMSLILRNTFTHTQSEETSKVEIKFSQITSIYISIMMKKQVRFLENNRWSNCSEDNSPIRPARRKLSESCSDGTPENMDSSNLIAEYSMKGTVSSSSKDLHKENRADIPLDTTFLRPTIMVLQCFHVVLNNFLLGTSPLAIKST